MNYTLEFVYADGSTISEQGMITSDIPIPIPAPGDTVDIQIPGVFRALDRTFVYEYTGDGPRLFKVRVRCERKLD